MEIGDETGVFRILDAAANRAAEALRVVEDYTRFRLDDAHLTQLGKNLRHDLAAALEPLAIPARLSARDTSHDIGTNITTPAEMRRESIENVIVAAFSRLSQSLRSLEEYSKTIDNAISAEIEPIRYRSYTLQRAIGATADGLARLELVRLMVLIDGRDSADGLASLVRDLMSAGVCAFQLRDKRLDDADLLARARTIEPIIHQAGGLLFINDRPDLAALSKAAGVHLGQTDMSVKDARSIVGPRRLIGVSTHTIDQAKQAVLDGASYLGVGPTFPSTTKQFEDFPGLDFVREASRQVALPAFVIGGVTPENIPDVIASGGQRVAIAEAIAESDSPAAAAKKCLDSLAGVSQARTSRSQPETGN
jgi:thiamine-phosphate pyrophosphorylase